MAIKAIETLYSGHRFRSRTEARWAILFDSLRADWQYEPEGFVLSDGTRYLPDFLIDTKRDRMNLIWIEVKATSPTKIEIGKLLDVCKNPFRLGYFLCGQPGPHKIYKLYQDCEIENCLDGPYESIYSIAGMLCKDKVKDELIKKTQIATAKSRAARFEFGEKP